MLKQQLSVVCFNVFAIGWPSQLRAALSALFYVKTRARHFGSMCVLISSAELAVCVGSKLSV
jgi:hypothetical protein